MRAGMWLRDGAGDQRGIGEGTHRPHIAVLSRCCMRVYLNADANQAVEQMLLLFHSCLRHFIHYTFPHLCPALSRSLEHRAVSLQAEAARVADDASLTPDQRQALLASRYATLMAPAVLLLERQLRATAVSPPDTPAERRFTTEMLPRLRAATAALRDGTGVRDWARPQPAWTPLRAAAAALARQQRQPLPPMSQLSPRLAALVDTEVPLPGVGQEEEGAAAGGGSGNGWILLPWAGLAQAPSYNSYYNSYGQYHNRGAYNSGVGGGVGDGGRWMGGGVVTVAGVCGSVSALPTKTRPKRAALLGSDGATYTYLLKGREDLRMDERLMQVGGHG